jgi:O-antigen/teichoic acid export membrane protein
MRRFQDIYRHSANAIVTYALKTKIGRGGRRFINDVLFFYLRHGVVLVLTAVTFFLTARFLGPEEYGRFLVITALSGVLSIPLTLGIPASATYYLAGGTRRKRLFSTIIGITVISTGALAALFVVLTPYLARITAVDTTAFLYGIALSILFSWHNVTDGVLRGLYRVRTLSRIRLVLSIAVSSVAVGLLLLGVRTLAAPLTALLAGYWIFSALALRNTKAYWGKPDARTGSVLLKYAASASSGSVAGAIILNADKLIINSSLSSASVGIYGAYAALSIALVDKLVAPFVSVLFPFSVRHKDKPGLFRKAERGVLRIFLPVLLLFGLGLFLGTRILGKTYPTIVPLLILFALAAALALCRELLWWVAISSNDRVIHEAALHNVISIILNLTATFLLVNALALQGAAIAQVVTNAYNIAIAVYLLRKFGRQERREPATTDGA